MVRRGDIVYVDLNPVIGSEQGKTRPAVVIQHDSLNKTSNTTIVVPITSRVYDKVYPMHVILNTSTISGTIKTEQIRAIDIQRISSVVDSVNREVMNEIGIALQKTCDFY